MFKSLIVRQDDYARGIGYKTVEPVKPLGKLAISIFRTTAPITFPLLYMGAEKYKPGILVLRPTAYCLPRNPAMALVK